MGAPERSLCRPGDTCWVRLPARRVAFLVDGAAYFAALHEALLRARERVWIVGWDVQARTMLRPSSEPPVRGAPPSMLGPLLDFLARRNRRLRIHVLEWDYSLVFASERGVAPWLDLDWRTHARVRFQLDDDHPFGACLHEKIVVVDDAVAFVGGLDLTLRRWDTPAHRADEPGRRDPDGQPYEPFHDVQMLVEGDVVAPLAERIRRRWNDVAGERVPRLPRRAREVWPGSVAPALTDVEVAIARTEPGTEAAAVREVERLHLESIRRAERSLYFENQYFSAESVARALAERLGAADGPEVVLVAPSACSGWLEERTMGARRASLLRELRAVDRHGRLRVYAPRVPGVARVNVHSKLAIVDDRLVRIGSANLSNRSFGFDRECDFAVDARARGDVRAGIASLRSRLVAEHLGVTEVAFDGALRREGGSLIRAIETLRGGERTLEPLAECNAASSWLSLPVDPAAPAPFIEPLLRHAPVELRDPHRRWLVTGLIGSLVLLALLGVAGLAASALDVGPLVASLRGSAAEVAGPVTALAIAFGAQLFLPLTGLIAISVLALGPLPAAVWSAVGALLGSAAGWALGRFWLGRWVERIAPGAVASFRRRLRRRTIWEITAVRLAPVLPFALVNLAAGAARVPFGRFLAGTGLALVPGLVVVAGVLDRSRAAWLERSPAAAAAAAAALVAGLWLLSRARRWAARFVRR